MRGLPCPRSPAATASNVQRLPVGARSLFGLSSVVRCPSAFGVRAAFAGRRLRPRPALGSSTFRQARRSLCRPLALSLRTPLSLRSPFALGRAPPSLFGNPTPSNVQRHARALAPVLPALVAPAMLRWTRSLFLLRSRGQCVPPCPRDLSRRPLALWQS